jgi:fatty-acid desaturase
MDSESTGNYKLKFDLSCLIYFVVTHGMALLAFFPFAFSWSAVGVMFFLYWLTMSLGICLGYHRYLTHRGLTLPKWLAYTLVFFGTLACQDGPIRWVGQHRMHHAGADTVDDPHSAAKGFWWSHIIWMLFIHSKFDDEKILRDNTKDFCDDKYYQFLDNNNTVIQIAFGLVLYAIGGIPWVVWGIFVRMVVVYHFTWFINSAAHSFGYINFPLKNDLATNCWWLGLLAWGEGWHNNHHAFPKSARHGMRALEIDMTWWFIYLLETLRLAKDIKVAQLIPRSALAKNEAEQEGPAIIGKMITRSVSPPRNKCANDIYF